MGFNCLFLLVWQFNTVTIYYCKSLLKVYCSIYLKFYVFELADLWYQIGQPVKHFHRFNCIGQSDKKLTLIVQIKESSFYFIRDSKTSKNHPDKWVVCVIW